MIYADTDFFIALIKPTDWLKDHAIDLYRKHHGNIETSAATIIEVALISKRFNIDAEQAIHAILSIVPKPIGMDFSTAALAAEYMSDRNLNPFDAFHAAYCGDQDIISSDKVFDKLGLRRIPLEKPAK